MCLTSLRVRIPLRVLRCDATTGNGPVLKTGDPRRRTGGSSPSHSALQTWLNWQKHLPAKEGPGDRHAGSRPAVCVYCQQKLTARDYSRFYTRSLMTNLFLHVILGGRITGPQVRKGKAMLQIHTDRMKNANRQFDLQGTIMPTAKKAEWFICVCLNKTGSSGYLGPGALARAAD